MKLKSLITLGLFITLSFFSMSLLLNLATTPVYGQTANAWNIQRVTTSNLLNFYYSNTGGPVAMTLTSGGNVGIGTTNPVAKLDITGGSLKLGFTTAPTWDTSGYIWAQSSVGNRYDGLSHEFDVGNSRTFGMIINSAGNIGIGDSNPGSKFRVADTKAISGGYVSNNLLFTSSNSSANAGSQHALFVTATTTGGQSLSSLLGQQTDYGPGWGSVGTGYGLFTHPVVANGQSMTTSYNLYAGSPQIGSSAAITSQYGIYIAKQEMANVGRGYGVFQVDGADDNYFAGKVGIRTSNPTGDIHIKQTSEAPYTGGMIFEQSSSGVQGHIILSGGNRMTMGVGGGYIDVDVSGNLRASGSIYANNTTLLTSTKTKKENFNEIDSQDILKKIDLLPIKSWNYKNQDASIKHIGPFSEDFHELFGLGGSDDKVIATVDENGIALAGIKALSEKLNKQQEEIELLKKEIEELKKSKN